MLRLSAHVRVLLSNCKQNITSLSLLVGMKVDLTIPLTVQKTERNPVLALTLQFTTCIFQEVMHEIYMFSATRDEINLILMAKFDFRFDYKQF